jgi:LacI family repressor for deo operon, udp, cdd, tsx, nupC, and nupG
LNTEENYPTFDGCKAAPPENSQMSSIKDVAKIARVSIATVSRYINSPDRVRAPTAKRVKEAIKITGYETNSLARNFRIGKTQQIMVVLPSIGIPFYGPIMEGVRKVADSVGYHILVMETAFNSVEFDNFTKLVMSKQTDGIILLSTLSPFKEPNIRAGPRNLDRALSGFLLC